MAITDTATDTPSEGPATGAAGTGAGLALPTPTGAAALLGSGDHTTVGRLWIGASGLLGVGSLVLLGWYFLEAARPAADQTDRAFLNLTLALLGLVLGLVLPLFIGLATVVVPLQIGASTIAFPRAAAAALWGWLTSMALLAVSYLPSLDGGVGGGKVDGSVLTYLALIGAVASLLLGVICVMTTVVTLRPPGMTLDRVPLFSWAMLVAGGVWLLTLPMLAANALFVVVDLKYGAPSLFGRPDHQWSQLSWLFTPPQVLAWALPALGVAGDAVATFARGGAGSPRQPQRAALLVAIGAAGAAAFGVYVQPASDPFAFRQWPVIAQVVVAVLPVLAVTGGFATALRRGVRTLAGPLVLAAASLLLTLLAVLAGVLFVVGPLDLQSTSARLTEHAPALAPATAGPPIYAWGVLALALAGGLAGAVAGLVHWSSKVTGRQLPAGLAPVLAAVLVVGGLALAGPLLLLGFANKADGLADSSAALLVVALVGAVLVLAAVAAALAATAAARAALARGGDRAERDPWGGGATLEWLADSPPAPGNFGALPPVESPEPLVRAGGDPEGGAR